MLVSLAQRLQARDRAGETGATAVEYALMVALITLVIFAAVQMLGLSLVELFANQDLRNALS